MPKGLKKRIFTMIQLRTFTEALLLESFLLAMSSKGRSPKSYTGLFGLPNGVPIRRLRFPEGDNMACPEPSAEGTIRVCPALLQMDTFANLAKDSDV